MEIIKFGSFVQTVGSYIKSLVSEDVKVILMQTSIQNILNACYILQILHCLKILLLLRYP